MTYAVIDLEVTAENSFGRFCNPLDERNAITSIALLKEGKTCKTMYRNSGIDRNVHLPVDDVFILVGQNIKFDLLYLWENESLQEFIHTSDKYVWDTMVVEYLLRGQHVNFGKGGLDLDSLSVKYGGQVKDDTIKQAYKAGFKSSQIDKQILLEYNKQDVINTEIVFKAQLLEVKRRGIMPLIKVYMEHLLAVCEMEFNGLHVDRNIADKDQKILEDKLARLTTELDSRVTELWPKEVPFILSSPKHWSTLFFGGIVTSRKKVKTGVLIKSGPNKGMEKERYEEVEYKLESRFLIKEEWKGKKEGIISVKDEVLESLIKVANKQIRPIVELLREYREVFKLLTTYYYGEKILKNGKIKTTGVIAKLMPLTSTLHSNFNMSLTVTGRLSSSGPNMQNLPGSILNMFTSRFADGEIVEFDFSQLEVVVQAYLAQSEKMIEDIKNNKDFHRQRLAYALNMDYDSVIEIEDYAHKRKIIAKPISFQKAYGAAPQTIASRTGLPLELVTEVFAKEDEDYPEINAFYEDVVSQLQQDRSVSSRPVKIRDKKNRVTLTRDNEKLSYAYYTSLTGKRYRFEEKAVLTKRGDVFRYWPMPDIQNYPVQGTAADLVAMAAANVFKFLRNYRDKALLVNEVHDSIVIDCESQHKDFIIQRVSSILSKVVQMFKYYFKIEWNVPISFEVKSGKSWAQCKE